MKWQVFQNDRLIAKAESQHDAEAIVADRVAALDATKTFTRSRTVQHQNDIVGTYVTTHDRSDWSVRDSYRVINF